MNFPLYLGLSLADNREEEKCLVMGKSNISAFGLGGLVKMTKELSQKSINRLSVGAWIFLVLQALALVGMVVERQGRDEAIEAFLQEPKSSAIGGTLGYLIGINVLPIVALLAGLTLWRHRKSDQSKRIIVAACIALVVSSFFAFR